VKKPGGAQVTDRAVPVKIFAGEVAPERRQYFLKKWCQDERMTHFSIRDIIDWDYYIGNFTANSYRYMPRYPRFCVYIKYKYRASGRHDPEDHHDPGRLAERGESRAPSGPPPVAHSTAQGAQADEDQQPFLLRQEDRRCTPPPCSPSRRPAPLLLNLRLLPGEKPKDKLVGDIEDGLMHLNKGSDDGDLVKFPPKAVFRLHKRYELPPPLGGGCGD
jgi:hypothetical protein